MAAERFEWQPREHEPLSSKAAPRRPSPRSWGRLDEGWEALPSGPQLRTAAVTACECGRRAPAERDCRRTSDTPMHGYTTCREPWTPNHRQRPANRTRSPRRWRRRGRTTNRPKLCGGRCGGSTGAKRRKTRRVVAKGAETSTEAESTTEAREEASPNVLSLRDLATKKPRPARRGARAEGTGLEPATPFGGTSFPVCGEFCLTYDSMLIPEEKACRTVAARA